MSKEYRIREQKYKHGSLFIPQYRNPVKRSRYSNLWIDILDNRILNFSSSMEEATKVIENDIEKDRELKVEEIIIHNYPLNQNKDELE